MQWMGLWREKSQTYLHEQDKLSSSAMMATGNLKRHSRVLGSRPTPRPTRRSHRCTLDGAQLALATTTWNQLGALAMREEKLPWQPLTTCGPSVTAIKRPRRGRHGQYHSSGARRNPPSHVAWELIGAIGSVRGKNRCLAGHPYTAQLAVSLSPWWLPSRRSHLAPERCGCLGYP